MDLQRVTGAVGLLALLGIGGYFAIQASAPPTPPNRAEISERLTSGDMPMTFVLLRENAPEYFDTFIDRVETHVPYSEAAYDHIPTSLLELEAIFARYAIQATDEDARAALSARLNLIRQLEADPEKCSRYLVDGATSLSNYERGLNAALLDQVSFTTFTALIRARRDDGPESQVTDEDWIAFENAWIEAGATEEQFLHIVERDLTDLGFCSAFASFLNTMVVTDGAELERVRVSFFSELVAPK